jgi:hypothetical protein
MIRPMRTPLRVLVATALLGLGSVLAWSSSSGAVSYEPALPTIKPNQVGQIKLGDTVASLSERGLIGGLKKGCELDPGQRVAKLKPPLKGTAFFFHGGKRLSSLGIAGGAETAKHIGVGSTIRAAKKAYPSAEYDKPGSLEPFSEGFLWVPNSRKPKMTFVIEHEHNRVIAIDLPSPNFCE